MSLHLAKINEIYDHSTFRLMWTYLDWEALQQSNFYQGEQQIQHVVTAVGQELTRQLLESKVTSEPTLCHAGQVWYRKADSVGTT